MKILLGKLVAMIQKEFADRVKRMVQKDENIIGLAVAGSWISDELDEYSDLDLILVSKESIGGDTKKMLKYAESFGDLLSGFTGEHVGEPRLLICMYDDPLLHVDIKFLTLQEFEFRVEDPVILFERDEQLSKVIRSTRSEWPKPDFQWIEDRFWTWVHYVATKIGRGEYFDALNAIEFIRMNVLSPLMQEKNLKQVRGLRRVETQLSPADLENLKITVAQYNRASLIKALDNSVSIYRSLRRKLYTDKVKLRDRTEKRSMEYFKIIKDKGK
jgi:predicted nucleotidyltransferase